MNNELLADLQMWVRETNKRRHITIEFGDPADNTSERIWVYDYDLGEGASIICCEDLKNMDLKTKYKERITAAYNKAMEEA